MDLKDKVAVVLGASAEGGTGWAIAEKLAQAGARVVVGARRYEPLADLARRIDGFAVQCDAGSEDQIASLATQTVAKFGRIDIAVNSAATPTLGLISDTPIERVQRSLDVNFLGHVSFVRYMAANMNDHGAITLISTASTTQPVLPFFPYACAKAATDCLVRYAALELGARGIRINSILPGPIKTAMAAAIFAAPGAAEVYEKEIALRRVGEPSDFADAVLWLSGNHYITGVNLPVSGGLHLTRLPRADEMPKGEYPDAGL